MIYTKRHEVLDLLRHGEPVAGASELRGLVREIFEDDGLPHYVLTPELMESLDSKAVSDTCTAMCQAGVARLPHNEMMVESKVGKFTLFMLYLQQKDSVAAVMLTYDGEHFECIEQGMLIELEPEGRVVIRRAPSQLIGDRVAATFIVALVLSHTRGLAKEVVTSESMQRFNKSRAAKKRAPVMAHTVLRVGRVYCKQGKAMRYTEGSTLRRPHLRKGHARKQKYGPNWSQERWIFVPACFINWEEGDDVPAFKTKVVTP